MTNSDQETAKAVHPTDEPTTNTTERRRCDKEKSDAELASTPTPSSGNPYPTPFPTGGMPSRDLHRSAPGRVDATRRDTLLGGLVLLLAAVVGFDVEGSQDVPMLGGGAGAGGDTPVSEDTMQNLNNADVLAVTESEFKDHDPNRPTIYWVEFNDGTYGIETWDVFGGENA